MRLAVLCDAIYPFHYGGKETLQHERAVRLAHRGHSVRIHTMRWWGGRQREMVREGVVLDALAPRVGLYGSKGRRTIWQAIVFGVASFRLLWAPPFDVLDVDQFPLTHFFAARLVCRLRRRPMTATWYEVWSADYWRSYMGWLGPLGVFLQRYAARSADVIFACSQLTARRLTAELGVAPDRVVVLSPGIDQPVSLPLVGRAREGVTKTVDCIFVGRLLPHKRVHLFLRALALLPDVTGLIIGSGPEGGRLRSLAKELGLDGRVTIESADRPTVLRQLAGARLFVFPSAREGFGVAVLEANACGVPALVVEHPNNAAVELVEDGVNGFIAADSVEGIARQIAAYLGDPEAQERMSKAARGSAARHSWDAYVNRLEAALDRLAPQPLEEKAA